MVLDMEVADACATRSKSLRTKQGIIPLSTGMLPY
jgi:hypothetical protein